MSAPEVLVIIPARGGSKGIPLKNIADIGGKPLLGYAIDCALRSKYVTKIVVSTDNEQIADVARSYGVDVLKRPDEISGSRALIGDAVRHVLHGLSEEGYQADIHCILLPPHLFRQPKLINSAVEKVLQGYHSVQTLRPVCADSLTWFKMQNDRYLKPVKPEKLTEEWSPHWYREYGNLSVFTRVQNPKMERMTYSVMLTNPIECIDIDTPADLEIARTVVHHNLYDFDLI